MEWVMERVTQSEEDFSPDQFDADATLLSDKLFEAFLSEPFDAPSEPSVPPGPSDATSIDPPAEFVASPSGEPEPVLPPVAVDSTELSSQAQPEVITGPDAQALPTPEETPGLSDLLTRIFCSAFSASPKLFQGLGIKILRNGRAYLTCWRCSPKVLRKLPALRERKKFLNSFNR